jgi:hypothetical protein
MIYGAVGDTSYDIMRFIHVLAAIVGFGSTFVYAVAGSYARKVQGPQALGATEASVRASNILTTPFTWLTGLIGFGLVGMSDDHWEMTDAWILSGIFLWFTGGILAALVLRPLIKRMVALQQELVSMGPPREGVAAAGPPPQVAVLEAVGKRVGMVSGILHLMFVMVLYLMVFKPGA